MFGRRRKVPFIAQATATECSVACLAMNLAYHRRRVLRDDIRLALGTGRDGASALALLRAADRLGLQGRGLRVAAARLGELRPGAVLHWQRKHFVVLEGVRGGRATILDPALGRRVLGADELAAGFSGLALELWPKDHKPSDLSQEASEPTSPTWALIRGAMLDRRRLAPIVVTSLALVALAALSPLMIAAMVGRVGVTPDLELLGAALGVFALGLLAAGWLRERLLVGLTQALDRALSIGLFRHLLALPWSFFQVRQSGDLGQRLAGAAPVRQLLVAVLASLCSDGALVLVYLALLVAWSPALAAVALGLAAVQATVAIAARGALASRASAQLVAQAQADAFQLRVLAGMHAIKAMGSETAALRHWSTLWEDAWSRAGARDRLGAAIESLLGGLRILTPLLLVYFGAREVAAGALTVDAMIGSTYLALAFLGPMGSLIAAFGRLPRLAGTLERMDDVLRAAPEAGGDAVVAPSGPIVLDDVTFAYDAYSAPAVRGVSLTIEPGQRVAIVGRSGAGKSTLASLILGLHRPSAGAISIGGRDLRELDPRALRRRIGVVTQSIALVDATVRDNLVLGASEDGAAPPSEAAIVAAAEKAGIHQVIAAMPMGYDTLLLDGGHGLSGGQRQRLALARALVREPGILLLDEATSALDPLTEAAVLGALEQVPATVISIAHRPAVIERADRVLVMDEGRVVEDGTHAELLARGGLYAQLVGHAPPSTPAKSAA
ncbi:MAG: peptidase domain-containing ABC transporter [Nannocystaceae bacterium]